MYISELLDRNKAFKFVMDSAERVLDISEISLASEYRGREVVDVRKMVCKVLRSKFNLSFSDIGKLLNRDHSTMVYYVSAHEDLCMSNGEYLACYNALMEDIKRKMRAMNNDPVYNGQINLKEIHSSEKDVFSVVMKCFETDREAKQFINDFGILKEHLIYHGQTMKMPSSLAKELVMSDEKRFVSDIMKRSGRLHEILTNKPVVKYYINYATGEFNIMDEPMLSYESAAHLLGQKDITVIYMKRQR